MISTIIISLILAVIVISITVNMIKKKKKGESSCGCGGCKNCAMSGMCHEQHDDKDKD